MKTFGGKLARWANRPAAELDAAALSLVADAQAAARLRAYKTDPNVAALTIERARDRLDRWGWLFLFAGLAYTTVNVQAFVAAGAQPGSLRWITAWLVEPMVMGLMLVLLRGEQIANRYGEQAGGWVRGTRWAALAITYVMNTGAYWGQGAVVEAFIHSVPVVLVFLAAEALVQQRQTLTTVVDKLGRAPAPERPVKAPQIAQERPKRVARPTRPADELQEPRTLKERAYDAFKAIADGGKELDQIGPAEVDKRADIRVGTSKVPGRLDEFRERYLRDREEEVSDGDQPAAVG